jgi:hypothetical protein
VCEPVNADWKKKKDSVDFLSENTQQADLKSLAEEETVQNKI